jgi:hypothetical protein
MKFLHLMGPEDSAPSHKSPPLDSVLGQMNPIHIIIIIIIITTRSSGSE